jgi:hypothetical protein
VSGIEWVDGKIYIIAKYIYEMDISNGKYIKVSKEGGWGGTISSTVKDGKIILLLGNFISLDGISYSRLNAYLYSWDPKDASQSKINSEDWGAVNTII